MKINPKIFKAYDIRGLYPSEINEDVIYLIGQCFIRFLEKEQKISPNKKIKKLKIVIGRDNRLSSQFLFEKLSESLTKSGADVVDIGLSTTPMLYWACAHYKFDGGLMITASHLGKEYNGLKLVRENSIPISEKTGLKDILRCIQRLVKGGIRQNKKNKQGNVEKKDVLDDYLNFNFNGFNISSIKSIKIVIDTANAVPGILIPGLKKALPITIYHLFNKLDGNFPNHSPDPIIKENLYFLQKEVKNKKADLGVAFDGDGDRIVFLDEKGNMIPGDLITALLATLILKKEPGQLILYDIRSSNSVRDAIKENGGEPVMSRIGHSFIKEEMRKKNIFFGGEFSGHYYAKNHYF
jgi:phosphomannomutase